MKKNILEKAKALEDSLSETNNKSSSLFEEIGKQVSSSTSNKELKEVLEPLKAIGSISQYGDFSNEQDMLLAKLLKEINYTLSKL